MSSKEKFRIFGTQEGDIVWFNYTDATGLICSILVWAAFLYAWGSSFFFYEYGVFNLAEEIILNILFFLSAWSHIRVVFSDPGAVKKSAQPCSRDQGLPYVMCGRCNSFKPPKTHHGKIFLQRDLFCVYIFNHNNLVVSCCCRRSSFK